MKPSLSYIFHKVAAVHDRTRIEDENAWKFDFEWLAIASVDTVAKNGFLYFIDPQSGAQVAPEGDVRFACVVVQDASEQFAGIPRIVLPNGTEMSKVFDYVLAEIERFRQWDEAINEILLGETSLEDVLDATFALVPRPMYIADTYWRMVACADDGMNEMSSYWLHEIRHGCLPLDAIERLNETGEYRRVLEANKAHLVHTESFNLDYVAKTVKFRGRPIAFLFIINTWGDLGPCEVEIAEKLGKLLGPVLGGRREGALKEDFSEAGLASVLESVNPSAKQLASALATATGWKMDGDFRLAAVRTFERERSSPLVRMRIESLLGSGLDSCVVAGEDTTFCLYHKSDRDYEKLLTHLEECAKDIGRNVVLSERFSDFSVAPLYYRQFRVLLDEEGFDACEQPRVVMYKSMMAHMLAKWCRRKMPRMYSVDVLADYDAMHGTDYVRTLYMYLARERNTVATAAALYMHRNSVHTRIERICELIEDDLDDADTRLCLLLALNDRVHTS